MTSLAINRNGLKFGVAVVFSILIASSWLVFPYFIQGKDLLRDAGSSARMTKGGQVSMYLTRILVQHPQLELTATFATDEFFQYVDRATTIGNLRPDKNFIFFVSENIHEGQLSSRLPEVSLRLGEKILQPDVAHGPTDAEHHRITVYSFPKRADNGEEVRLEDYDRIRLFVANPYLGSEKDLTFIGTWEAPYRLPEALKSSAGITPVAMLALGAGLLSSVLTPCLLQLVVIFGSIIGAFSTVPGAAASEKQQITPLIRKKVMLIAVAFVSGFLLLYTLAGAVIGAIGHSSQLLFAEHSRSVAVYSGVLVIALGLWAGFRGLRGAHCAVPGHRTTRLQSRRDMLGALLVSMGYALGCTACFGGAIVATLIIYVGAIGSASIGAGIMFVFSVGVAIPFLLSAWYISKADSVMRFFVQRTRLISLLSMILIVLFGLILITDNFHTVSDFIYPLLRLS